MHILIDGLGSRVGGGITGLWGLVSALPSVAPEHKYTIVLSSTYQKELIKKFSEIIDVIPIEIGTNLLARAYFQNFALNRIISRVKADMVYFSGEGTYFRCVAPSILVSGNLSLFVGKSESALMSRKLLFYKLFRRSIALRSMQHVTRIGFVSEELRRIVLGSADIPIEKTFLMPHGVREDFYNGGDSFEWKQKFKGGSYLLSVSSINQNKGYDILLSAYADLKGDVPPLVIAGQVVHEQAHLKLLKIIKEHALEDKVFLIGHVPHEKLPGLYAGADLFVFPTYLESFGIPLIEAMASGLPIITSDLNICKEVCDDAVVYFKTGDTDELKQKMIEVMGSGELKKELSAKARQRAKNFTWESTASKFITVAEEICS